MSQIDNQILQRVFHCSPWAEQCCQTHPQFLVDGINNNIFKQIYTKETYLQQLALLDGKDILNFGKQLRLWRKQAMLRIIFRCCASWASLYETLADLSALADAAIYFVEQQTFTQLTEKYGTPLNQQGEPQHLVIVALGKLGGEELNLSSDIDLLFAHAEEGELAKSGLSYADFYQRQGQQFIKLMNEITAEGFVFRVDMRLRPYGDSGPLVMSFTALENYYQAQGREWERYALIKARPVTGSIQNKKEFMQLIRPFVYRRYVDYTVLQSLREMHNLIEQEVQRKNLQEHIKLGAGGIRAIEFIVQMHQLIRGGREPILQQGNFFNALNQLRLQEIIPINMAEDLRQAYVFLRNTEHALQAVQDQQTHTLPHTAEERQRLVYALNFETWEDFYNILNVHRNKVIHYFAEYAELPNVSGVATTSVSPLVLLWKGKLDEETAFNELKNIGFVDPEPIYIRLRYYAEHPQCRHLTPQAMQRLLACVPGLLIQIAQNKDPLNTLTRTFDLVMAVVKRSAYLVLLIEKPKALERLVFLCGASLWVSQELVLHPMLLDELLDERTWARIPKRSEIIQELQKTLNKVTSDDTEQQMDALRKIKHLNFFRVAVVEIQGILTATDASKTLSMIAQIIVQVVFVLVWRQQIARFTQQSLAELLLEHELVKLRHLPFAVIAYGNFASAELNYTSDLDLVFLYETQDLSAWGITASTQETHEILLRMAKRMMHWLNTPTTMGILFRIDTQLQPEGSAGLLVSEWQSFADYQLTRAWLWEQQALVRARMVYGVMDLRRKFRKLRRQVLCQSRTNAQVREEILAMRSRMQRYNKSIDPARFNLKTDSGGMVDIEFIIQYAVLCKAAQYPELIKYPDNARLCKNLCKIGALTEQQAQIMLDTYTLYREQAHHLALQNLPAIVEAEKYQAWRAQIKIIWDDLLSTKE